MSTVLVDNPYLDEFNRAEFVYGLRRGRSEMVSRFSWAIPSQCALDAIAAYAPIVEIGAGSGYWAHLLRQMGVDVIAYDLAPPESSKNFWHPDVRQWTEIEQGDVEALAHHQDRALLLCWPPYANPMGLEALRHYQGSTVIYVGERDGGCTGCDDFHLLLQSDWEEQREIRIPQWDGMHDSLRVFTRRSALFPLTESAAA